MLERGRRIALTDVDCAIGEVGMEVDEAGKDRFLRPVDRRRPVAVTPRPDRDDLSVNDPDALVAEDSS
jgi:hypothetical protein